MISIIIPCRNEERYIEKCLKTILEQDYQGDMEVLVVLDRLVKFCSRKIK